MSSACGGRRRQRLTTLLLAAAACRVLLGQSSAFLPSTSRAASREGLATSTLSAAAALPWWAAALPEARADQETEALTSVKSTFSNLQEAQAAAERLRKEGASDILSEPVNLLPPEDLPDMNSEEMTREMVLEATKALSQGDIGNALSILGDAIKENGQSEDIGDQSRLELFGWARPEGISWDQIGFAFFTAALLANSAKFVWPLLEEGLASEEKEEDPEAMLNLRRKLRRKEAEAQEDAKLQLPPRPASSGADGGDLSLPPRPVGKKDTA
eukprot:TRINITY_DN33597_c0_g1_i1.p1 TRINITY_DN33597_c0_g1~~TRINITY_DN33597_c0_g1_i1.p1  ORF type:complete len:296 (+),score=83.76 TRINITY_DN33597_c0_g1_i1:77-889(+)